jgi:predicted GIY-YIG superfamily endonuclease
MAGQMHYAYILESIASPGEFYRGYTTDLRQRVADHNSGKCPHTSKFRPWRVKFYLRTADAEKWFGITPAMVEAAKQARKQALEAKAERRDNVVDLPTKGVAA